MIRLTSALAGYFKMEMHTVDDDGNIVSSRVVADWFPNIITYQGLDEIATNNNTLRYCQVGTGNTTPAATDTELDAYLAGAGKTNQSGASSGASSPYYGGVINVYRFGAGVGTGNIQGVGVGWASSGATLFSRTLTVDGGGSPVTITKLANEILDVSYWHRVYAPVADVSGTVTISGSNYDYVARAAFAGNSRGPYNRGWGLFSSGGVTFNATATFGGAGGNSGQSGVKVYTGSLGTVLSEPSGTANVAGSVSNAAYTPGTYEQVGTYTWSISEGNLAGGIRSVLYSPGFANYQIEFDPPLPKDATKQLQLTFIHTWSRKTL